MAAIPRPDPQECGDYLARYLEYVPAGDVLGILADQHDELLDQLDSLPEELGAHRYAEGKWSIKDVVCHLVDTERLFTLRALWFARGAREPQPGMDQDGWAAAAGADSRTLDDLLDEYRAVRASTLHLFRGLDADAWTRRGTANGVEIPVSAYPFILAGHERHHLDVLRERYL